MGRTILEDDWVDTYKPKPAPRQGSGYDYGSGCTLVDGYSKEDRAYLESCDPKTIWTVVSGDGDAIVPGFHYVNRLGNIVTELPYEDDIDEVELEAFDADNEGED